MVKRRLFNQAAAHENGKILHHHAEETLPFLDRCAARKTRDTIFAGAIHGMSENEICSAIGIVGVGQFIPAHQFGRVGHHQGGFGSVRVPIFRIGEKFQRPVLKKAAQPGDTFSFADGAPILVTSEASLAKLNDHILENDGEPVPMDRFRPNLVIAGIEFKK